MSRPAVVFGGPSDEHDISILTGLQIARALDDVHVVYWAKSATWHLVPSDLEAADFTDGVPAAARPLDLVASPGAGFMQSGGLLSRPRPLDVGEVLIACHGGPGEDGTLQGLLDLVGLRYTGPGQSASALGMDKLAFGAAMAAAGLPSLDRALVADGTEDPPFFDPPFICKPRFGGSSIGIEVAADWDTALALSRSSAFFDRGMVVEPFLEGSRDLQVAVRTHPGFEMSAVEAPARTAEGGIYSYDQKYLAWGGEVSGGRELPATMTDRVASEVRSLAERVTKVAGIKGITRIDFLEKEGDIWVNEINTIPGSMGAYLWIDPEISRRQLFVDMLAEAAATPTRRFSTAGSDGTALRNAGTIASKLG